MVWRVSASSSTAAAGWWTDSIEVVVFATLKDDCADLLGTHHFVSQLKQLCYTFQCTHASYVGDAGNTPLVDAGTRSGRDYGRYSRECWLSALGVLHPGVTVMWYAHIRDLFPTAEAVRGAVCPR